MKVTIGISNRHVHLTKETYKELFERETLEKRNDLNQIGEYASLDTVTIEYNGKIIENVRIIAPFRKYNQIELLGTDLEYLGIEAPIRRSGDLENTPGITLINGDNKVQLENGVIRSERHVHVPSKDAEVYGLIDKERVVLGNDKVSFDAFVKISDNAYFEVHIDKDEALQYGLSNGDEVEIYHV